MSSLSDELRYLTRGAFVRVREQLGISKRGNATYYVERLDRALRANPADRNIAITACGKNDGAGSQAQASMSAIAFARAHGLKYIHRPFTHIEHAETDMPTWIRTWEEYFNLGAGEQVLPDVALPVVSINGLRRHQAAQVISAEHYLHFCNRDPEAWERVRPELQAKFWQNKTPSRHGRELTIAVHMRRGDVCAENSKVARNFTPNATFVNTLRQLKELIGQRAPLRIEIFSQGNPQMFADLADMGAVLRLDAPAIETHRALVEADIFVMSKGAFSYTAGVLNQGITLYDPQKYRALRGWIIRDKSGSFDRAAVSQAVDALIARRGDPIAPIASELPDRTPR